MKQSWGHLWDLTDCLLTDDSSGFVSIWIDINTQKTMVYACHLSYYYNFIYFYLFIIITSLLLLLFIYGGVLPTISEAEEGAGVQGQL